MIRRGLVAGLLLVIAGGGRARAQLKDCPSFDPQHATAYTVFLDDIVKKDKPSVTASADGASLAGLIEDAHAALHLSRSDDLAVPLVEWKTCPGRFAKTEDFVPNVRRDLLQFGVVLEIYGDSDGHYLDLRHAIIPAMYDERDAVAQRDVVPITGDPGDESAAVNKYRAHLLGYMEVSLALRLVLAVGQTPNHDGERQLARRWMCDGVRLIFGGGARPPASLAPDQAVLLETLARRMGDFSSSSAYERVRGLLQHGERPVDVLSLFKESCLGPGS